MHMPPPAFISQAPFPVALPAALPSPPKNSNPKQTPCMRISAARRARVHDESLAHPSDALPPSPAEWLREHHAAAQNPSSRPPSTKPPELQRPTLAATTLFNRSPSSWLYITPPSYCNIPTDVAESISSLDSRVYYLGPVTRNKVLRAIELAQGAMSQSAEDRRKLSENISIAQIVADLQMECDIVCAAILNGIVGRTGCSPTQVERLVGAGVLQILEYHRTVTQSITLSSDASFTRMSFSNLRELILVGAMEEQRALNLELASAVLAIRTVDALPDHAAKIALARRTMYLYAPLANQLGIWHIQGELEELAFMYLQPESFHRTRLLVGERRRECRSTLRNSKEFLEKVLSSAPEVRAKVKSVEIKGRVKGLYSVYRKMQRSGKKIYEIYDLLALRIVVEPKTPDAASEEAACYAVSDVIKRNYETFESRAKDYIASPKRNGYRSLHQTVLPPEGGSTPLEIQIRSAKMHHVAEFGAAAHWIYKDKRERCDTSNSGEEDDTGPKHGVEVRRQMEEDKVLETNLKFAVDRVRDGSQGAHSEAGSALRSVRGGTPRMSNKDIHEQLRKGYITCLASAIQTSRVIVATAGQLYGLAVGSTLLDLAHGLGVASLGAIAVVNGSVAPLTQRLEMNDIVSFISALPEA